MTESQKRGIGILVLVVGAFFFGLSLRTEPETIYKYRETFGTAYDAIENVMGSECEKAGGRLLFHYEGAMTCGKDDKEYYWSFQLGGFYKSGQVQLK